MPKTEYFKSERDAINLKKKKKEREKANVEVIQKLP